MARQGLELGGATGAFYWDASEIVDGLNELEKKTMNTVKAKAVAHAAAMTRYARANKKWKDITGQAKGSLHSWVEVKTGSIGIYLSHGVYYGVYLELSNERNFAIIEPTLRIMGPRMIANLAGMFDQMGV